MNDESYDRRCVVQAGWVLICSAWVIAILADFAGFDTLHTVLLTGFGAMLVLCFAPTPERDE